MSKFQPLTNYLKSSEKSELPLAFGEIERILGFSLPASAKKHRAYFSNSYGHSIAKAWLEAGYITKDVDIYEQVVTFEKRPEHAYVIPSVDYLEDLIANDTITPRLALTTYSIEAVLIRGKVSLKDISQFVRKSHATLFDIKGNELAFAQWVDELQTSDSFPVVDKYRAFVKGAWLFLLERVVGIENIAENERVDLFVPNIPLCDDPKETNSFSNEFARLYEVASGEQLTRCVLDLINGTDINGLPWHLISCDSFLRSAYLRMAITILVETSSYLPWMPSDLFLEMVNVIAANAISNTHYITKRAFGQKALIGKARQVIVEDPTWLERTTK